MSALRLLLAVVSALRVPGPLSPKIASYQIDARLDAEAKTITGKERLTWRNAEAGPASELVFHLYMNAFKNESSAFLRESNGSHRGHSMEAHGWGAIDVSRLTVDGVDLTHQLRVDDTLATVTLPRAIRPGRTVAIDVEWKTTLPKIVARTGYHADYFAIAQWFPKIGVFECSPMENAVVAPACRWRAHQHHWNSEFFADYGDYDVTLDLPSRFVVGATGVPVAATENGERTRRSFHAEDVLDFAIAAYPGFVVHEESMADPWGEVQLVLLEVPGRESNAARHLAAARVDLAEYERRLGPYPYRRLTIVDVIPGADGAGGMEYPTLFFTDGPAVPAGAHLPEMVTAHELGHQFFEQLVASDEVEEAWLDEGLTQAATEWALRRQFGEPAEGLDLMGHAASLTALDRLGMRARARLDPIATPSFAFAGEGGYAGTTYDRTQLTLRTVENLVGEARFEAGFRRYYEWARFRHPREADFIREFDAGAATDLSWFWPSALSATGDLDYEVYLVEDRPAAPPAGLFEGDGGLRVEVPIPEAGTVPSHRSQAVIYRRGEMIFPVAVRADFADGSERRDTWDGGRDGKRWHRFEWQSPSALMRVVIDPSASIPLDISRWNDGRTVKDDPGPRRRVAGGFAEVLSTLLSLVGF